MITSEQSSVARCLQVAELLTSDKILKSKNAGDSMDRNELLSVDRIKFKLVLAPIQKPIHLLISM